MQSGTVIFNRYRLENIIGSGGIGKVYLAMDLKTGTPCAVKETADTDINRNEAKILKALNHPALPKVYDSGVIENRFYMVMEYISGRTLSEVIKENKSYDECLVISWYQQLCNILCYIHNLESPIAYRDLKPSNIIISPERNVRLIDFGIAEEYSEEHRYDKKYTALTKGYAAPEQYSSKFKVDVRTDIYALGATMHYLVTGKNPQEPPYKFVAAGKLNKRVSKGLEFIIEKSLQPVPEVRYQSAEELKKDLYETDQISKRINKQTQKRIRKIGIGFSCLLLCMIAVFIISMNKQNSLKQRYSDLIKEAGTYEKTGDYEKALELLSLAIEEEPDLTDAYLETAYVYISMKDYDLCDQYIQYVIEPRFGPLTDDPKYNEIEEALKSSK